MPIYTVTTTKIIKCVYEIDSEKAEYALDDVVCGDAKYVKSHKLDEVIVSIHEGIDELSVDPLLAYKQIDEQHKII